MPATNTKSLEAECISRGRADARLEPVSVLHVFAYFRPDFTGEGKYVETISRYLEKLGVRSDVIVERTRAPGKTEPPGAIQTVRYFGEGYRQHALLHVGMTLWLLAHIGKYDVVHFHSQVGRLFHLHLIAKLFGRRVVQSSTLADGLEQIVLSYRPLFRPLVRQLCRLIDASVAISPKLEAQCRAVSPPSRVHLVPQGTSVPDPDAAERDRLRRAWGIAPDETVLLCVASLCRRKDMKFLVANHDAFATDGRAVRLLLVGPELESDYAAELRQMVATSPQGSRVSIVGYMEDTAPVYRLADIFVFASLEEGFGNVLLEAMAHGLPVVSRRLPGVTDSFIEPGRTGFLFDTESEYRAAVEKLLHAPNIGRAVGAAARAEVKGRFDLAAIAARYAGIYRNL